MSSLPSDEQLPPSQVKKPIGIRPPIIGEDYCLRCRRTGVFMEPNGLCDDCEHEGRFEAAEAQEIKYRQDMTDAGRGHLLR
jgi:hypothetical protein